MTKRFVFLMALVLAGCLMLQSNAVGGGAGKGPRSKLLAPIPQTGQTLCYDLNGSVIACEGTGQDADYQNGVPLPTPRFTINGDGTVTDNLTKLVWLQNADRFGMLTWSEALEVSNALGDDSVNLTDGSVAGDWRLPNVREMHSLIHYGVYDPTLSNTAGTGKWSDGDPFTSVKGGPAYWTSTTHATPSNAWYIVFNDGTIDNDYKTQLYYVWPVRDAQ